MNSYHEGDWWYSHTHSQTSQPGEWHWRARCHGRATRGYYHRLLSLPWFGQAFHYWMLTNVIRDDIIINPRCLNCVRYMYKHSLSFSLSILVFQRNFACANAIQYTLIQYHACMHIFFMITNSKHHTIVLEYYKAALYNDACSLLRICTQLINCRCILAFVELFKRRISFISDIK